MTLYWYDDVSTVYVSSLNNITTRDCRLMSCVCMFFFFYFFPNFETFSIVNTNDVNEVKVNVVQETKHAYYIQVVSYAKEEPSIKPIHSKIS